MRGKEAMALPEPKPGEETAEVDRDVWKLLEEAKAAVQAWKDEVDRLIAKVKGEMGEATAATVDGRLVATNRPKETWRTKDLIKDYPDLTAHYFEQEVVSTFNMKLFANRHPEIAQQYQSRAFVVVD